MKLLIAAALAASLTAVAADQADPEDQPKAAFVQAGQEFTCTARDGCLVVNRAAAQAIVDNAKRKALEACSKGAV